MRERESESERERERERERETVAACRESRWAGGTKIKKKTEGEQKRYRGGLEGVHVGGRHQIVPAARDEEYWRLYCADPVDGFPTYWVY